MKPETVITSFEDWTLRIRPGTGKRILLLLHGWTGDENSMSIFTRNLPAEDWIISPRAPYSALPIGYSWRAPAPQGGWPTLDLLLPAIEGLIKLIERWGDRNGLASSSVDIAGFSQGGALTFLFGALHPNRVRKMGILAGFAPEGIEKILVAGLFKGKNIFLAHGTLDEMVPLSMAKRTIHLLEDAGAKVTYCESEVGHKLSAECLRALERYLMD